MLPKNREFLEFEDFFFLKNFLIHFKSYKITDLEKVNHQKALNGFYKRFLQAYSMPHTVYNWYNLHGDDFLCPRF